VPSSGASVYGAAIDRLVVGSAPGEPAGASDVVAAGVSPAADAVATGDAVAAAAGDAVVADVGAELLPHAAARSAIAASPAIDVR
jgi:hypothetical protein